MSVYWWSDFWNAMTISVAFEVWESPVCHLLVKVQLCSLNPFLWVWRVKGEVGDVCPGEVPQADKLSDNIDICERFSILNCLQFVLSRFVLEFMWNLGKRLPCCLVSPGWVSGDFCAAVLALGWGQASASDLCLCTWVSHQCRSGYSGCLWGHPKWAFKSLQDSLVIPLVI